MTDLSQPLTHVRAAAAAGKLRTSDPYTSSKPRHHTKLITLSKACKDGKHWHCFAKNCACKCNHGGGK